MKKDATKIANDGTKLKEKAKNLTGQEVDIDDDETVGNGSFSWKESPEVCAVLVYRDSGVGSVKVTSADENAETVTTGPGKSGIILIVVKANQTCMLHGSPTV
jgi:hypothetical protein